MKIFFNRVPRQEPYGGGNQFLISLTNSLLSSEHEVVYRLEKDIDLIFIMDPRPGDIGYGLEHIIQYKNYFPKTKIIHRVNECDKRKGTDFIDSLLIKSMNNADEIIFISEWLKEYFSGKGFNKKSKVIYNGCNSNHFYPQHKVFNKNKIKLVTHHWSDNWMKGFDLYTKLDEFIGNNKNLNYEFTYIGRYYKEYKPKFTNLINPIMGIELGNELRKHDIYVTASKFEPCGMHHVEGSASGLPVLYHSSGGGINELCSLHGEEFSNFNEFLTQLDIIINDYTAYQNKINYVFLSMERCISQYLQAIEESMS